MASILVVEGGEALSAVARDCALALGADLREMRSVQDAMKFAGQQPADLEACVLGPGVGAPVQAVQRLHSLVPDAPLVLVTSASAHPALSRALRFSPFVSPFVRCLVSEPVQVAEELDRAVRDFRRRRRHRATIASLNQQFGPSSESSPQRRTSEYLGRLLEVAPIGVVTSDPSGAITACNAKAASLFETTEREALGTRVADWFEGLSPGGWSELVRAASTGPVEQVLHRHRRQGGKAHLQVIVANVSLRDAEPSLLVALLDVTARHELERQRDELLARERAARAEAEAASRAKDEFLSMVSHELRTPLSSILGWAHMLASPDLEEEKRRRGAEVIGRNARALAALIEDVLDVSRIVAGKLRLDVHPVDPVDVIEMAMETVRPAAEAKGVRLVQVLTDDAGPIMGDAGRLQQVVWNLLANAVKFTRRGGRVQIRLRREGSSIELIVEDDGEGIAPEFLAHVFERFRQQDPSATRAHGGLGLGLSIVRHLVELHGGTVHAASAGKGQGATFTVRIPVAPLRAGKGAAPAVLAKAAPDALDAEPPVVLAGVRILVVDDEPDSREMLAVLLEGLHAVVEAVPSVREALAAFERQRPDVILSDIGMPQEDGFVLVRKIRARPAAAGGNTPVVALTAGARPEDRTRALRAGFDIHLAKPVQVSELVAVIENLARRRA